MLLIGSQTPDKVLKVAPWMVNAVAVKEFVNLHFRSYNFRFNVADHVKRMCPQFDLLDEIFGHKSNVVPPYIYESSAVQHEPVQSSHESGQSEVNISDAEYLLDEFADNVELESVASTTEAVDQSSTTSQFKEILTTVPLDCIAPTAATPQEHEEKENISRFKRRLLNSPAVKDKMLSRNSTSILADAHNKKAEAILGRNEIEKNRIENERLLKLEEASLARDKFLFEKEARQSDLELRKMEIELRDKEIQSRERIEMFRIEMEAKHKLEIAKLGL